MFTFCIFPDILSVLIFTHRELVTANPFTINKEAAYWSKNTFQFLYRKVQLHKPYDSPIPHPTI